MEDGSLELLKRTHLTSNLASLIKDIQNNLPELGRISSVLPIHEGYEDANFLIESESGKYVLKIFSKGRPENVIKDYRNILLALKKENIPSLELMGEKEQLFRFLDNGNAVWYIVTKFFDGFNFVNRQPSIRDLEEVTCILARMNNLQIKIHQDYDSWGNKNLVKEFEAVEDRIDLSATKLIKPVVEAVKLINFDSFSSSFIHGDMQKKHVLKNMKGEYCIIDFGCMAYDKRVYELSTFLAWFVYDELAMMRRDELTNIVLGTYTKYVNLSNEEVNALPVLVRAAYASYFMKTHLLIKLGDKSKETLEWHQKSQMFLSMN